MKLLLTGATGFVGRNFFLSALAKHTYDDIVIPVRNRERFLAQCRGDSLDTLPASVRVVEMAAPSWDFSSESPFDHVVHCAGILAAPKREEYFRTNVEGTLSLLRTLRGTPNIVLLSSQAAAGPTPPGAEVSQEADRPAPVTWYGESKLAMENAVREQFPQASYVVLRPPMVLGARDQASLPLFWVAHSPLRPKPGLRPKRYSFVAVSDLVSAIEVALVGAPHWPKDGQRAFFVAHRDSFSDVELLSLCGAVEQKRGWVVPIPTSVLQGLSLVVDRFEALRKRIPTLAGDRVRELLPDRWVVTAKAFEDLFPWRARASLAETLAVTADWYRRTGKLPRLGKLLGNTADGRV